MEVLGLEVEEELSTVATQTWAEEVWIGKWHTEQKETLLNQVFEVQRWRQERGLAGAVMCETCDLGIKWPHWYTLLFEGEVRIDLRYVCPKDVKKMLLQQARSVYWKKWAAKHEYEELKEGAWLEPVLAVLRKKHRNVARKWVLERGWVQIRLIDFGWSDDSKCQACHTEEGTEKHTLYNCHGTRSDGRFQRLSESGSKRRELERRSGNGKEVL